LLGAITGWRWVWLVSLVPGAFVLVILLVTAHVDFTGFTPGVSDNASGTGLALALAERATREPLRQTRLWTVAVGCEEVHQYGSSDFYRRHASSIPNAYVITLDNLGIAGPAWLLHEGLNIQFHSHPDLLALAEKVAAAAPELGAYPQKWDVAFTDSTPAIKAGLKTITLLGVTREKKLPYYHVPEDTIDKLRPDVLANTAEFAWRIVRAIDGGEVAGS
jgi:Zn-dependent M28 family amino/carboxypeptidase